MARFLGCTAYEYRVIGAADSSAILEDAVAARALVDLRTTGDGIDTTGSGKLIGGDATTLTVELQDDGEPGFEHGNTLELSLARGAGNHVAEVRVVGIRAAGNGQAGRLILTKPKVIARLDRRMSPRRGFVDPIPLTLTVESPSGEWKTYGAVLNLSTVGAACRIDATAAERLFVGAELVARFRLPSDDEPFRIPARVTNLMPAGSARQCIVGIEFMDLGTTNCTARIGAALEAVGAA